MTLCSAPVFQLRDTAAVSLRDDGHVGVALVDCLERPANRRIRITSEEFHSNEAQASQPMRHCHHCGALVLEIHPR